MLSELQKRTVQAIVNIFETGRPLGDYGRVAVLAGDPGHLTYGRSQTTLASGNLHLLVKAYCDMPGAARGPALKPYLRRLAEADLTLDRDRRLHALLREAGDDPVMRDAQDGFFDRVYWFPATTTATVLGFSTALGVAVIYDSLIHGSWKAMRERTTKTNGAPAGIGEQGWIGAYVRTRRAWLSRHPNALLQHTAYRMEAFQRLIAKDNWRLDLPFTLRGVWLDRETFTAGAPVVVSASDSATRNLRLANPPMAGEDVRTLQQALRREGYAVDLDGVFGRRLETALKSFQREFHIVADGIAGPATRTMLGL